MSPSIFSRAAAATVFLASTTSAVFSATASSNVVMYWGAGDNNMKLVDVCNDPSIDVVNLAFINQFPKKVGDYPGDNFGNACWAETYPDPFDSSKPSHLYTTCEQIGPGIKTCQAMGKKVLLSLGGGGGLNQPANYYLPDQPTAAWFAKFLVGAFGPPTKEWTDAGLPRPFGDSAVDGYDLDLEADQALIPSASYLSANYAYLVNQIKAINPSMLISAAPQCIVPDARLSDAIANAPFDMVLTQFYNTPQCSARTGFQQIGQSSTDFTFNTWAQWLQQHSFNRDVKLYMGLPAGPAGAPAHTDHFLQPLEANALITKWRAAYPTIFGGVMLWEATVNVNQVNNCQHYSYWIKSILNYAFSAQYPTGCTPPVSSSSSSVKPSSSSTSIKPSSSATSSAVISSTSSKSSSAVVSSTTSKSSSAVVSSTTSKSSSAVVSSSSSSALPSSSKAVSSSIPTSSSMSTPASSSVYPVSSASSTKASSSAQVSSSAASSTIYPASSGSSYIASSVAPSSSSAAPSSSIYVVPSSSASSSIYVASSVSMVYSSATPSSSAVLSSVYGVSSSQSSATPASFSKSYPVASMASSSSVYAESVPAASSTPCASSSAYQAFSSVSYSQYYATPSVPVYGSSSTPVYGASSSVPVYGASSVPVYGASTSSMPVYAASTSSAPVYGYSVSSSASSTTTTVTTTYVDSCSTGVTTVTATITKTICAKCTSSTPDSMTSTYVCNNCGPAAVTYTITKPYMPATDVPSYPTSTPAASAKPSPSPYATSSPAASYGVWSSSASVAKPMSTPSSGNGYTAQPIPPSEVQKQQEKITSTTVSIVYVTKTPVPMVPEYTVVGYSSAVAPSSYAAVPYPSGAASGTGYPIKPSASGTGYPSKPSASGTGYPTKPSSYVPPAQFTGAASRVGAGMGALVAIFAAFFVL